MLSSTGSLTAIETINYWNPVTCQCISTFQHTLSTDHTRIEERNDIFHFDETIPTHLRAYFGTIDVLTGSRISTSTRSISTPGRPNQRYGIDKSLSWITYDHKNIIRLPYEFQPNHLNPNKADLPGYAICETPVAVRVAIACDSGTVIRLTFAKEVQFD
jgi:hypothetical protein